MEGSFGSIRAFDFQGTSNSNWYFNRANAVFDLRVLSGVLIFNNILIYLRFDVMPLRASVAGFDGTGIAANGED